MKLKKLAEAVDTVINTDNKGINAFEVFPSQGMYPITNRFSNLKDKGIIPKNREDAENIPLFNQFAIVQQGRRVFNVKVLPGRGTDSSATAYIKAGGIGFKTKREALQTAQANDINSSSKNNSDGTGMKVTVNIKKIIDIVYPTTASVQGYSDRIYFFKVLEK